MGVIPRFSLLVIFAISKDFAIGRPSVNKCDDKTGDGASRGTRVEEQGINKLLHLSVQDERS